MLNNTRGVGGMSRKVWIDVGSWALIQMLLSFFFLLVKGKHSFCWVWHSFDYFLWGLHVFYTKLEVEGLRRGRGKRMKPGCIPNIVLYSLCSCKCPSTQNFGGNGHDLFIDNNCYRTSKGHTAKPETWREYFEGLSSQMQNGKDGTQQLLGSSSQPRQECSRWPKPSTSGLYLTFYHYLTNSHIYQAFKYHEFQKIST